MAKARPLVTAASLDGFSAHFDVEECLMHIAREFGRIGVDERALLDYQRELFHDLTEPLDEQALSSLYDYWEYDLSALFQRGRTPGYGPPGVPAKPRIDIIVEVTTKHNLKAEWFPRDWDRWGSRDKARPSDFPNWMRFDHRHFSFDSRPSNELLFLRGVGYALRSIPVVSGHHPMRVLDQVLLAASWRAVGRLKSRLKPHFDIKMLKDVFTEWNDPDFGPDWRIDPPTLLSWVIEDPQERQDRADKREYEEMQERLGFGPDDMLAAIAACSVRAKSGPRPSPHTRTSRIVKIMKGNGLPATNGKVDRAMILLRRYRTMDVARAERSGEDAA
jgi:hypothetical protein